MRTLRLIVLTGREEGISLALDSRGILVGRADDCDVALTDPNVSRRHAQLEVAEGSAIVTDLGSSNGTFVNGERVEGSAVLRHRAELRVGETVLIVVESDDRVGTKVGRYDLLGLVGEGGMASVYLARHRRVGHIIALKMLSKALSQEEQYRTRFEAEWRAAAATNHPNILNVFDGDEVDGEYYLAMPYVRGADLSTLLKYEGAMDPGRTLVILRQVASALDRVHSAAHLVHRDVKPANILVANGEGAEPHDHAYLCDFGISKNAASETTGLTPVGRMLGSIYYMSPEQIQNEGVDPRTDVYALGCVAYACFTGSPPFEGDDMAVMYGHVNQPRPLVSRTDPRLGGVDDAIVKALAVERERRFDSCGEFIEALSEGLSAGPTELVVTSGKDDAERTVERRRHEPPPEPPATEPRKPFLGSRAAMLLTLFLVLGGVGWLVAARTDGFQNGSDEPRPGRLALPATATEDLPEGAEDLDSPPEIEDLDVNLPKPVQVQLIWSSSGDVSELTVFRNGSLRKKLSPTAATYRDSARPNTRYTYTLVAESDNGSSDRESIRFRTRGLPSVGHARLAGTWRVRHTYRFEDYLDQERGDVFLSRHYYSPKCPTGPCDTKIRLWGKRQLRFGLIRGGPRYHGGTTVTWNRCEGSPALTRFDIEVQVTHGRFVSGKWRATRFRGTLERTYPSGDCVGPGSVEHMRGRLIRAP